VRSKANSAESEAGQLELFRVKGAHRNAAAVERTIRALRSADRLEELDAGLVAAARTLARALDSAPSPYVTATVGRVHLEALRLLAGRPAPEPDELDAFLRSLTRPAPVRDET
jgi:hypothetical protein